MKKEKKNIFKVIQNVFKKQADISKSKKAKKQILKKKKPRGLRARQAGVVTFWVLFSFMFLVVFINVLGGSNSDQADSSSANESKISSPSAIEFSKSFIYDLIRSSKMESGERQTLLNNYVSSDLTNQIEEAFSSGQDTTIEINRNDIVTKEVEKTSEEMARHFFEVQFITKTKLSEKEMDLLSKAKDKGERDKVIQDMLADDKTILSIKNNEKIRLQKLYFIVPIKLTKNNEFVVYQYPSFTYMGLDKREDNTAKNEFEQLKTIDDGDVAENVKAFLESFFDSFSQQTESILNYLLEDSKYNKGLNNTLEFKEISDITLYEGKGKDYIANVKVNFIQSSTQLEVSADYVLVIAQKGQHYIVKHINNDKYIQEVVKKRNDVESVEENKEENIQPTEQENKENIGTEEIQSETEVSP